MKTKSKKPTTQPLATTNPRRPSTNDQGRYFFDPPKPSVIWPPPPTSNADLRRARVMALIGSLHQNHLQWAELVVCIREEGNLTYKDLAQLTEQPIARIRQACATARRHRAQLLGIATTN